MERMEDKEVIAIQYRKISELEKENKNLRDYAANLDSENDNQAIEIEELKKENKKLKKYYDRDKEELMESCYSLARENDELKKENENLNEKVRFLEECLDRKEKLNEKYRKEIEESHVYDAKQVRDIC